ncbi:hypothetical protein BJD58_gp77 [Gordonia phage UmaThurman]|uniref:hypothetical protein n=1 Tax=Gordonia phage UmaThurman TaxID=1821563 RepID=UPI00078C487F|nr:hypothetical protein BJD58_gp77 [Gordonia phage UmaThurman]AMS03977.1 hypothetical protein SEA_UMATHURMAN_77 [Gordonia phage UmaThurman]
MNARELPDGAIVDHEIRIVRFFDPTTGHPDMLVSVTDGAGHDVESVDLPHLIGDLETAKLQIFSELARDEDE